MRGINEIFIKLAVNKRLQSVTRTVVWSLASAMYMTQDLGQVMTQVLGEVTQDLGQVLWNIESYL
jgi:hypothetical protein